MNITKTEKITVRSLSLPGLGVDRWQVTFGQIALAADRRFVLLVHTDRYLVLIVLLHSQTVSTINTVCTRRKTVRLAVVSTAYLGERHVDFDRSRRLIAVTCT